MLSFQVSRLMLDSEYNVELYLSHHVIQGLKKNYVQLERDTRAHDIKFEFEPGTKLINVDPIHACIGIICYHDIKPTYGTQNTEDAPNDGNYYRRKHVVGQQCVALEPLIRNRQWYAIDIMDPTRPGMRIVRESIRIKCTGLSDNLITFDQKLVRDTKLSFPSEWSEIMDTTLSPELLPMTKDEVAKLFKWRTDFYSFVRNKVTSSQPRYRNYHFQSWTCFPAYVPIWCFSMWRMRMTHGFADRLIHFVATKNNLPHVGDIMKEQTASKTATKAMLDMLVSFVEVCCLASYASDYYPDLSVAEDNNRVHGVHERYVEQVIPLMYNYMNDCEELGSNAVLMWYWFFNAQDSEYESVRTFSWIARMFVGEIIQGAACDGRASKKSNCKTQDEDIDPDGPDNYVSHVYGVLTPRTIYLQKLDKDTSSRLASKLYSHYPKQHFESDMVLPLMMEGTVNVFPFISPMEFIQDHTGMPSSLRSWLNERHARFCKTDAYASELEHKYRSFDAFHTQIHPLCTGEKRSAESEFEFSGFYRRVSESWSPVLVHFGIPRAHFEVCHASDKKHAVEIHHFFHAPSSVRYISCLEFTEQDIPLFRTLVDQQYPDPVLHDAEENRVATNLWAKRHERDRNWVVLTRLSSEYRRNPATPVKKGPIVYYVNHTERLGAALADLEACLRSDRANFVSHYLFVITPDVYYIEIQLGVQ